MADVRAFSHEIITVAHRLDQHEGELRRRIGRARRGDGDIGQDHRQRRQRGQNRQRRAGTRQIEALFRITQPADEQAQANNAVDDDHHRGKYRVTRQCRRLGTPGEHERNDQRDLDGGHRQCQHQCAEGLADTMRDDLGMVNCCQHRRQWCPPSPPWQAKRAAAMVGRCCRRGHRSGHGVTSGNWARGGSNNVMKRCNTAGLPAMAMVPAVSRSAARA